jgi:thiol:disulfide interchange protein
MAPLGVAFNWLREYLDDRPINWVPYSADALDQNLREGRTVLVSFTATWDVSARMNDPALATPSVRRKIRSMKVVAMRADYTDESPEVRAELESLGQRSIPIVAIYPARSPEHPIVLRGLVTEEQVLNALSQAAIIR